VDEEDEMDKMDHKVHFVHFVYFISSKTPPKGKKVPENRPFEASKL
jgi:hypothetical protein